MECNVVFDEEYLKTKYGALRMVSHCREDVTSNIVLLHGLVVNSTFMTPTAEQLASTHNVFIPEMIGNGKSETPNEPLSISEHADSILEALEMMNVHNPVIVGGSYGSQVAVELATRVVNARALVFIGPLPGITPFEAVKGLSLDAPHEPLKLVIDVLIEIFRMGILRVIKMLDGICKFPFHERLETLQIPTLIVSGEHDPFYRAPFMEKIAKVARTHQRLCMPKAAHGLPYSKPREVSEFILSFLDTMNVEDEDKIKIRESLLARTESATTGDDTSLAA